MMTNSRASIEVSRIGDGAPPRFSVVVRDKSGQTRHEVTLSPESCALLMAGVRDPERCIEAAFRFLLDRERKESILGKFDLMHIARYFPEFTRELTHYLSAS